MPRKLYGSVNGQTKQIKKLYGSVNGLTKEIKKLYGSVGGVTKQIFPDVSTATLDIGVDVNAKIKNLANNTTDASYLTGDSIVTGIVRAASLPTGFVPSASNTISSSSSSTPIYIFFNSGTGVMNYYSEATTIYMNSDFYGMFSYFFSLVDISGLSEFDTSNANGSMFMMFANNQSLTNLDSLSGWDVSGITNASYAFDGCVALSDISGIANWDTSNFTDIHDMFRDADNIDATVLNNWDVSNVTNMTGAFTCPASNRPSWYTG